MSDLRQGGADLAALRRELGPRFEFQLEAPDTRFTESAALSMLGKRPKVEGEGGWTVTEAKLTTDGWAVLLTLSQDRLSESGRGWTWNLMSPWWPSVNCYNCGRFIGRDGHFSVERFEMSDVIASLDGECARCAGAS